MNLPMLPRPIKPTVLIDRVPLVRERVSENILGKLSLQQGPLSHVSRIRKVSTAGPVIHTLLDTGQHNVHHIFSIYFPLESNVQSWVVQGIETISKSRNNETH